MPIYLYQMAFAFFRYHSINFCICSGRVQGNAVDRIHAKSPQSPAIPNVNLSYLAGPAVLHNDGRPEVSRTGVDRILLSGPVQGSWQPPRGGPGPLRTLLVLCPIFF